MTHSLPLKQLIKCCYILFVDFNQVEFHLSGLIQIIKKEENENKHLQAINENLKKENEHVSSVNKNLLEKLNKLDKESNKKISRFVVFY